MSQNSRNIGGKKRKKTYIDELTQFVGPIQEGINCWKIALARNIRQLNHNGSSISSYTKLFCGIWLTFNDGSEDKITLGSSELPMGKSSVASINVIKSLLNKVRNRYELFL